MIQPGTVVYLPPLSFQKGLSGAFLKNLEMYPPRNPCVFYTDPGVHFDVSKITDRPLIHLNCAPERLEAARKNREPRIGRINALFVAGLRIARTMGFTHVLYLETDCRVGDHGWDEIIFNEYFSLPFPTICAGSVVCWNMMNSGLEVVEHWQKFIVRNAGRPVPVLTYGTQGHWRGEKGEIKKRNDPSVFPNGALGVYDLAWLERLGFGGENRTNIVMGPAWDFQLGDAIWKKFGVQSFEAVAHMDSQFSGYGDDLTTEDERMQMLKDRKTVAVHHIKSGRVI